MTLFMDEALSRRLERAEGQVSASFAQTQQREAPNRGSSWRDFDGVTAIYDGATSPVTQTFGLGLFTPATPEQLGAIEAYFLERKAPVLHEISPLAGIATTALLVERGYRPIELSSVLVFDLAGLPSVTAGSGLAVRRCEASERLAWVETSVQGWGSEPELAEVLRSMAETASKNAAMAHFLVERDRAMIATGSVGIHDDVAVLAGASTVPSGRGLGAQGLLLAARLKEAHARGCTVAVMAALPGSTSQRNAERRGFRIAYSRTKWRRD